MIEPIEVDAALRERLAATHFDWMIFTSGNAVESALRQPGRPKGCRVAAIGRATARALEAQGVAVELIEKNGVEETARDLGGRRVTADHGTVRLRARRGVTG